MREVQPIDWDVDNPPTAAEAEFAYWAFRPDDQPAPEWMMKDEFESEEEYARRMDGDNPAGEYYDLQRWPAHWEPGGE